MGDESRKAGKILKFHAGAVAVHPFPGLKTLVTLILFLGGGSLVLYSPTRWLMASFRSFSAGRPEALRALMAPLHNTSDPVGESSSSVPAGPRPVTFRLLAPAAKMVYLGGNFNGFLAIKHPMSRRPDGLWEATVPLLPGKYTYKFKVDGRWQLDPTNPLKSQSGKPNSLLEIE